MMLTSPVVMLPLALISSRKLALCHRLKGLRLADCNRWRVCTKSYGIEFRLGNSLARAEEIRCEAPESGGISKDGKAFGAATRDRRVPPKTATWSNRRPALKRLEWALAWVASVEAESLLLESVSVLGSA